jgi:hypothetical protein
VSHFPEMFSVGRVGQLEKTDPREWDGDPRGLLWVWEPPIKSARYVLGADPTVGRTLWTRFSRVREDAKTDNAALEIIKVGKNGRPDMQVAEYAAPCDAFELGYVINILSRLYAGEDEEMGCKVIIEVFPGPGAGTLQTCLELGVTNLFRWEYYGDSVATPTKALGWHASPRTCRDLWVKASRHLVLQQCIVRSPWLAEEYADCRLSMDRDYAENPGGHDDRVRAFNLALWVANSWSVNIERTQEKVTTHDSVDYQLSDLSLEEIHSSWQDMFDRIG